MTLKDRVLFCNKMIADFIFEYREHPFNAWFSNGIQVTQKLEDFEFHTNWEWLMPVVEKIQKEYRLKCVLKESDIDKWGHHTSITIFGKKGNWKHFYWYDCVELAKEIEKTKQSGDLRIGHRLIVPSKIDAVWLAVIEYLRHVQY